jgi:hypothetical protein
MANEKSDGKGNQNHKIPVNAERIAAGEKDTQQQRLKRGSKGNPSSKDWQGFLEKQKQRSESEKSNLDAKIEQRKTQLDKPQVSKEAEKQKDHDKNK